MFFACCKQQILSKSALDDRALSPNSQIIRVVLVKRFFLSAAVTCAVCVGVRTLRCAQRCHELTVLFACRIGIADTDRRLSDDPVIVCVCVFVGGPLHYQPPVLHLQ